MLFLVRVFQGGKVKRLLASKRPILKKPAYLYKINNAFSR